MSDAAPPRNGLKFDPTINAGHILTFVGFLLAGFVGWTTLDKRVVVLEQERARQNTVDQHQDTLHRSQMDAVRESLADIKQGIKELSQRLENRK